MWVATHELGHILGLEHDTTNRDAVMYPYYRAYTPNMQLHRNDIARLQRLYGRGRGSVNGESGGSGGGSGGGGGKQFLREMKNFFLYYSLCCCITS